MKLQQVSEQATTCQAVQHSTMSYLQALPAARLEKLHTHSLLLSSQEGPLQCLVQDFVNRPTICEVKTKHLQGGALDTTNLPRHPKRPVIWPSTNSLLLLSSNSSLTTVRVMLWNSVSPNKLLLCKVQPMQKTSAMCWCLANIVMVVIASTTPLKISDGRHG